MSTIQENRGYPVLTVYPDNAQFWEAASKGILLVKYCRTCDRPHWYPRTMCPHCGSDDTEFREASGMGSVYSVSVTRPAGSNAYAIAYVRLDEGVTMITNIINCGLEEIEIGDRVRVVFERAANGLAVPMFQPAE